MPVGNFISLSNEELKLGKQHLQIDKRLHLDLISEVYQGKLVDEDGTSVAIAVKVMKPVTFEYAHELFEQECQNLADMQKYEEEANKEQQLALKVAPRFYGHVKYDAFPHQEKPPYFVMELVNGTPLAERLWREGTLTEAEALEAGWQLYRTLDFIHTRLKKTFVNLPFENLLWVEGENGREGHLKLLDLSMLESVSENSLWDVKRDLLQAAVYLCAILTGTILDYARGRLRESVEPVIQRSGLSWGTRQLLQDLLHLNRDKRPTQAATVAESLRTLANFWQTDLPSRLLEEAEESLLHAQGAADIEIRREHARRARAALDIASRRMDDDIRLQAAVSRADDILNPGNFLENGRALFNGRSYNKARERFEEGMRQSEHPAALRRWAYVARIGEEVPSSEFDRHRHDMIQAMEKLNEGNWQAAADRLAALSPALNSSGLSALQADCDLFTALEQAQRLSHDHAPSAIRQANEALRRLPETDIDIVQRREVGNLKVWLVEMAQDQEAQQAMQRLRERLIN